MKEYKSYFKFDGYDHYHTGILVYDEWNDINKELYAEGGVDLGDEYRHSIRENTNPGTVIINWSPMRPNVQLIRVEELDVPIGTILTMYHDKFIAVCKWPGITVIASSYELSPAPTT